MKCSAKLTINDEDGNILKLFSSEDKEFQNNRAFYSIKIKDSNVEFQVEAVDASAMRAILNSLMKNLVIYEKVESDGKRS